ncbi:inositol phosphoceramide mannosyltransferase 2-like [Aplysia californica]|uniref:Inositol phosphoceramide mannosyltransferase 2-like n=1 Tax=Aplysia californica TaxID=6500 RepID=A0ABM0JWH2_APLCA|nr:inositol phosphoceramide mannosyltransferase 2-like [Aplysia californica]
MRIRNVPVLRLFLGFDKRKQRRITVLIGAFLFLVSLHFILKWDASNHESNFANLDIDIPENFVPVRVTEREPLPVSGSSKIPKIIHQTWKDVDVPIQFSDWIKSWLSLHPDWEYWLWTDSDAEQLIAEKYPSFLEIFKGYTQPIRKADALRYFVLYEYGGLYVDMDMEALTPIDPLTQKYSCFIGQEPYEHPILDTNFEKLLINALIGCRKGHPFMKMLIDSLPAYSIMWNYLDSTGPHFVTSVFRQYEANVPMLEDDDGFVYVTPSEYFYPFIDPDKLKYMFSLCSDHQKLTTLQLKACRNLKFKYLPENSIDLKEIAFTNHHWYHTYLRKMFSTADRYVSIYLLIPRVKTYNLHKP